MSDEKIEIVAEKVPQPRELAAPYFQEGEEALDLDLEDDLEAPEPPGPGPELASEAPPKLRCREWRPRQPWPSPFEDRACEEEFVKQRRPQALVATRLGGIVWLITAILFGMIPPPSPAASASQLVGFVARCLAMVGGVLVFCGARLLTERGMCAVWSTFICWNLALNRFRTSVLVGEDPFTAWGNVGQEVVASDSLLLMCMVAAQAVFFLSVPIRLFRGWYVALLPALSYAVTTLPLPDTGAEVTTIRRVTLVIVLGVVGWFAMLGQARNEELQRQQFLAVKRAKAEVVKERVMRFQAEHQADPPSSGRQDLPDLASEVGKKSVAGSSLLGSVTATEKAFESGDQVQLMSVGLAEHWILNGMTFSLTTKVLGTGGFGLVRRGFLCGVNVAVKISKADSAEDGTGAVVVPRSLCNEIRVFRRIRHPNVVCFFGIYLGRLQEGPPSMVMVMEEVVGPPLTQYIMQEHPCLQPATRTGFLLDVCSALWYLHEMQPRIVHGDLKASNIMVEKRWEYPRAKLIDFGLSRVMTRHTQVAGGTHAWAPPEYFFTPKPPPTEKYDVFSFGRLAFFVVTATFPCMLPKDEIKRAALDGLVPELPWPAEALPLMQEVRDLCETCLDFDPRVRPLMGQVHEIIARWGVAIMAL